MDNLQGVLLPGYTLKHVKGIYRGCKGHLMHYLC